MTNDREYILTARPGYTIEEAIENTSIENACIEEYEYGLYLHTYPAIPLTIQALKPKPHPAYMRRTHVVLREGEKVLKKPVPENMLTTDVNPFFQVIQRVVVMLEGTTMENIIRSLIQQYLWFEDTGREMRTIELIVEKMNSLGLLVKIKEKKKVIYKVGLEVESGYRLVDLVRGYDPFEYQIMEMISNRGVVSNKEIHSHIIEGLKWTKNVAVVENYLIRLRKKGCITKTGDWYRYKNALKPIGKTSKMSPMDVELRRKDTLE
jgi:hypothetical protein